MSTQITKPIFLDETGREMADHLKTIARAQQVMADFTVGNVAELTMERLSRIIKDGQASHYFLPGDQLTLEWTDKAASDVCSIQLDIGHHFDGSDEDHPLVKLKDGTMVCGMGVQMHTTLPFGFAFSPKQAFYVAKDAMEAGTYTFDVVVDATWGSGAFSTKGTKSYQFTLTNPVEAGAQFVWSGDPYSAQLTAIKVLVYAGFSSIEAAQQCEITEGSTGTSIGSISTAVNGQMTTWARATYGNNNWPSSKLRLWLNSAADANAWDKQMTQWDRPHHNAAKAGFLTGLPADFLSIIGEVEVKTQSHPGDLALGEVETTYDRIFPLSARQHYFSNYLGATSDGYLSEGVPWDYWKRIAAANGKSSPWVGWGTYPELITYDSKTGSARSVWLRSASRSLASSYNVGSVSSSGTVTSTTASNAGVYAAPACILV